MFQFKKAIRAFHLETDVAFFQVHAAQLQTVEGADEVKKLKKKGRIAKAVIINGFDICVQQLKTGAVDAVIIDKPVAESYIAKQQDVAKIVGKVLNAESYGFAVNKENKKLLKKINNGLKSCRKRRNLR